LRKALLSQEQGWRSYPLTYEVSSEKGQREWNLTVRVLYSSTCPCSAGLSRQALQDEFRKVFNEPSVHVEEVLNWLSKPTAIVAVPHSQRSEAVVKFTIDPTESMPSALSLIDEIETALGTPVQAAVKREDEQEFARRNAQNLMFCEDAARKLKAALLKREDVADFQIEVRHFESLHPHDVVAKVGKF
jgi:GTP cyclohydrolase I